MQIVLFYECNIFVFKKLMMHLIKSPFLFLLFFVLVFNIYQSNAITDDSSKVLLFQITPHDTSKQNIDYYNQGKMDAKKYYHHIGPFTGAFLTSFAAPPAGFLTSLFISFSKPKNHNLGIPYEKKNMILNQEYLEGYKKTAWKRKTLVTWSGFLTGTFFFASGLLMTGYTPEYFFRK